LTTYKFLLFSIGFQPLLFCSLASVTDIPFAAHLLSFDSLGWFYTVSGVM